MTSDIFKKVLQWWHQSRLKRCHYDDTKTSQKPLHTFTICFSVAKINTCLHNNIDNNNNNNNSNSNNNNSDNNSIVIAFDISFINSSKFIKF